MSRGLPVLNADGQVTTGNGIRSAGEPYTGEWGLPVLSTDSQITTTGWSDNEPYTGEWDASLR